MKSQKHRKPKSKPASKKNKRKDSSVQYRSQFERRIAEQLQKANVNFKYESESIRYLMPESKHIYKPDFILPNGIMIEAKGRFDSDARKKMALVKEQNPDLDIRIVFQRDQPIRKGSPTLYSMWADKLGYKYAVKDIPKEWVK